MLVYADRRISPFEGSPRAGAAEYVQRGDVLFERSPRAGAAEYMHLLIIRYAKVIKKYQSAKKRDCPFWGQSCLLKKYRRIDNLKLLR